jgi:hypothetical protein
VHKNQDNLYLNLLQINKEQAEARASINQMAKSKKRASSMLQTIFSPKRKMQADQVDED